MSWKDVEGQKENPEDQQARQERQDANQKAIDQCAHRAVTPDAQLPLRKYLKKIAFSRSFRPGRTSEETAWSDGYRALAVELLARGGMTHD